MRDHSVGVDDARPVPNAGAEDFRRRAASALTHPVTIAALGLLLVNDLLLKSLWPGSWVTGKLSDFAWLVFAMPLLAWLLSLASTRARYRRWAFAVSYAGLPLLYFLYNTFTPVYRLLIDGASLVFRYTPSSPQDATDSLVIPFAVMLALWVWRRASVERNVLRRRWTLLIASLAVLASIATSPAEPEQGVREVGVDQEGGIYAATGGLIYRVSDAYASADGGFTWSETSRVDSGIVSGDAETSTPRGLYSLDGADVMLTTPDGQTRQVYSTAFLEHAGNSWLQGRETADLGYRILATKPKSIVHDEASGNVILALGLEGVVIGTPDDQWHRVGVGPYTPTDFSFESKLRELLSLPSFWFASLTLSFTVALSALIIAGIPKREGNSATEIILSIFIQATTGVGCLAIYGFLYAAFILLSAGIASAVNWSSDALVVPTIVCVSLFISIGLPLTLRLRWPASLFRRIVAYAQSGAILVAAFWALLVFDDTGVNPLTLTWLLNSDEISILAMPFLAAIAPGAFILTWRRWRHAPVVVGFLLATNVMFLLAHIIWLQAGIPRVIMTLCAVGIAAGLGFALAQYLRDRPGEEGTEMDLPFR